MEKMSGTKADRPQLDRLRDEVRKGDSIYIESLSRLGRSTKDLLALIDYFQSKGVTVISAHESIDTSSATGKLLTTVMCALAEFERALTIERTQEGLKAARARGRKGGRKPVDSKLIKMALALYDSREFSVTEVCKRSGISQGTLYTAVRNRNRANGL